jgi:hypothetical protein
MSTSNLRHHKGITNLKEIEARSVFSQQNQQLMSSFHMHQPNCAIFYKYIKMHTIY